MKIVHWLFAVSVALFVSGIGFVIAAARAARQAPAAADVAAASVRPVASVKQIMKGIVGPAANVIYNAVGTTVTSKGTEDKAPRTDAEWEEVGNAAAALIESGNLLLMGNRAVDNGDWLTQSRALIEAGKEALKAVQTKNVEGVFASGEPVNQSCDNCHRKYQRGS
jgi:hypothetical protein